MRIKYHFHIIDFAFCHTLKQRLWATGKWPLLLPKNSSSGNFACIWHVNHDEGKTVPRHSVFGFFAVVCFQRAKKVVSDSLGLVEFAIGLVNFVLKRRACSFLGNSYTRPVLGTEASIP